MRVILCQPYQGEKGRAGERRVILSFSFAAPKTTHFSLTSSQLHCYFVLSPIPQEAFLPHSVETVYGSKRLAVQPEATAPQLSFWQQQ